MKTKKVVIAGLLCLITASAGSSWGNPLERLGKALQADQNTGTAWNELYDGGGFGGAKSEAGAVAAGNESGKAGVPLTAGQQELSQAAVADVPSPILGDGNNKKSSSKNGVWAGVKNGSEQGALLGFFAGIAPAASLLSEGMGRRMSRGYDGARSDNGNGGLYAAGGIVLGVLLYVPALVLGAVGGALGAVGGAASESVKPGSTRSWDAENTLFGSGPARY